MVKPAAPLWLNYHHLHYFWMVAREGSIAAAARELHLGVPTISTQLKQLETSLGEKLFRRRGRGMELTEAGRVVQRYADEIFSIGRELVDSLQGRARDRPVEFRVGVADVMPKVIAHDLLQPALSLDDPIRLICREGHPDELLAALALHQLDLVLSDAPIPPGVEVRAYNHVLGECGIAIFAVGRTAQRLRKGFPGSLEGAPFLLPGARTVLRRTLEHWFDGLGVRPRVVGEFDDGALLKVFGQAGAGLFAAPAAAEQVVCRRYGVKRVGYVEGYTERFYAITGERRIQHPAVAAISEAARGSLFVEST